MIEPNPFRKPARPNWLQWLHDPTDRGPLLTRPQDANGAGPTHIKPNPFHQVPMVPNPRGRKTGWAGVLWFCTFLVSVGSLYFLLQAANRGTTADSPRKHLLRASSSPKLTVRSPEPVLLAITNPPPEAPVLFKQPTPVSSPLRPDPMPVMSAPPPPVPVAFTVPAPQPRVELPAIPMPVPIPIQAPEKLTIDDNENPPFLALDPRGDTPMLRNWKHLALLAATIIVIQPPVVQAQNNDADIKSLLERIDKMDSTLQKSFKAMADDVKRVKDDLKDDINALRGDALTQKLTLDKSNTRLTELEKQMRALRLDMEGLKSKGTPDALPPVVDKSNFDEIKVRLSDIEKSLAKLQNNPNRISLSPPSTGRVLLVNLYNEDLLFVINQKAYRVTPQTTMPIEAIPSGNLSYEVISGTYGSRARNTINLTPNETFTLTAR